jgi:hypothetical protein
MNVLKWMIQSSVILSDDIAFFTIIYLKLIFQIIHISHNFKFFEIENKK